MQKTRLSKPDREKLDSGLQVFDKSLWFPPNIPQQRDIVEGVYAVFASLPDKVESVIDNNGKRFFNFGNDKKAAIAKKSELEKQGYHVFFETANADASGIMISSVYRNPVKFVEVVLHEGFHNNPCNKMDIKIEEPGAYLMGLHGAIEFFRIFGGDSFLAEARNNKDNFNRKVQRAVQRYQKRLEALSLGEVVPTSSAYNNAVILADMLDYEHYPLIRNVHRAVGYIGETRRVLTGLPSDLNKGLERLEQIVSST